MLAARRLPCGDITITADTQETKEPLDRDSSQHFRFSNDGSRSGPHLLFITPTRYTLEVRRLQRHIFHQFSVSAYRSADLTHAIVGAGVVGLAIARQLQSRDGASTVVIEQHDAVGTETSSRNSEVIHAGLYHGPGSLKTKLCISGKGTATRSQQSATYPVSQAWEMDRGSER